ncbi:MAG: hypothetical protein OWV35_12770 [Firmicutes bacterium]|nr:hypothetical protein [Bacillota bacterium]
MESRAVWAVQAAVAAAVGLGVLVPALHAVWHTLLMVCQVLGR